MLGERGARGKSIHSVKKTLDLREMDSLPLAACRRSAENDKWFHLNVIRTKQFQARAFFTRSMVMGDSRKRTPVSWNTALAIAGPTSGVPICPTPVG